MRVVCLPSALVQTVLVLIMCGCAGSGGGPVLSAVPGTDHEAGMPEHPAVQSLQEERGGNSRVLWGWYQVSIDPVSWLVETVPLRNAEYTFNVVSYLQAPLGSASNLSVNIVDSSQFLSQGRIDVNVSITHPFPGVWRLRGFDVMGVFMSNGTQFGFADQTVRYPRANGTEAILLNADGYTRWMNATEFTKPGLLGFTPGAKGSQNFVPTCTVNGYKYFASGLGPSDELTSFFQSTVNVTSRGSFVPGNKLTRLYKLRFPLMGGKPFIKFQYAVLASWAPAPQGISNPSVNDFPVNANAQEAIHISVADNGSNLYYKGPGDAGGVLSLRLEIFDWQGKVYAGVANELSHLWIEDPAGDVIPGGSLDLLPLATVTAGKLNSSVFTVDLGGCTPKATGTQEFLITAESKSPTSYDNGLGSPYPASAPLASFARCWINVLNYNPCPVPAVSGPPSLIFNVGDTVSQLSVSGSDFVAGPMLTLEFRRPTGNITGTNPTWLSSSSAAADFDFSNVSAGMYDFFFRNGCGTPAALFSSMLEVNTLPSSPGISGPTSGDATLGMATYQSNATDPDTDPVDVLSFTWDVTEIPSGTLIIGPVYGDPFSMDFSTLQVGQYNVHCLVSDGYSPPKVHLNLPVTRLNTPPTVGVPSGPTPVWLWETKVYNVTANDVDPGQSLTYTWSLVPSGSAPNFNIPGGLIPGQVTINFSTMAGGPGLYDLACRVDDGSGEPNATADSPPLAVYVASAPYSDAVPPSSLSQVISTSLVTSQGMAGCPSFWDTFYSAMGAVPVAHADISILSGPSLGMPGVMVIADEVGALAGPYPSPPPIIMGFAHYTCPFSSGNLPSWTWTTAGLFPNGTCMIPSVIHFDGNSNGELFVTNSQMTGKLGAVNDPSAFQHYLAGNGAPLNDLYTSLSLASMPDVAVDCTAGFDMGSPSNPMKAPLYGLFTQDRSGILSSCGGKNPGVLAMRPVHFMMFPSMGLQPPAVPVDALGTIASVAPLTQLMVGSGPGLFNVNPGSPCPAGLITYPEPYYALAIDDDSSDNPWQSNLPQPVVKQVVAAAIDADRDVEIYEIDFGVAGPVPAPLVPFGTIAMGSFNGGSATAYPLDCEFVSNFTGFSGTLKPVWQSDLLAVLVTEQVGGFWIVELYDLSTGSPVLVSASPPVLVPSGPFFKPGVAFRLDVDELTGEIYVIHQDIGATGSMAVTILKY